MLNRRTLDPSRRPLAWIIILASTIALGAPSVCAVVGFQSPAAGELQMTSEPQAPGAPAIILFREVDRDDVMLHRFEMIPNKRGDTDEVVFQCRMVDRVAL